MPVLHARPALLLLVTAALALPAVPAHARPDPGPAPVVVQLESRTCTLTRVGSHYARCDAHTGAGAAAPSWVPEQ
jgi:hypothetical protein